MSKTTWTAVIILMFCVSIYSAQAEQVRCQTGSPIDRTLIEISWSHSPGSPAGYQSLKASLKNTSRNRALSYTVKRKQKAGVVYYADVQDGRTFSIAIQSQEVAGSNLPAYVVLNKGLSFEETITDLSCTISGTPLPPVEACPNAEDIVGELFSAVRYSSADRVEWLLDCGVAVDTHDQLGCTPLLAACDLSCGLRDLGPKTFRPKTKTEIETTLPTLELRSLERVLALLLDRFADIDAIDPVDGESALLKLIKDRRQTEAELLIERDALVDLQDKKGNTALMIAAMYGDESLVRTVLKGKPDLSLKNKAGDTAFSIAEKQGFTYILQLLEKKSEVHNIQGLDDGKCTPMMVHLFQNKTVEITLSAPKDKMFLLTAPGLGIELMAMPGESASQTITPDKQGTFPFTCGTHGADAQTNGSFMVM